MPFHSILRLQAASPNLNRVKSGMCLCVLWPAAAEQVSPSSLPAKLKCKEICFCIIFSLSLAAPSHWMACFTVHRRQHMQGTFTVYSLPYSSMCCSIEYSSPSIAYSSSLPSFFPSTKSKLATRQIVYIIYHHSFDWRKARNFAARRRIIFTHMNFVLSRSSKFLIGIFEMLVSQCYILWWRSWPAQWNAPGSVSVSCNPISISFLQI